MTADTYAYTVGLWVEEYGSTCSYLWPLKAFVDS